MKTSSINEMHEWFKHLFETRADEEGFVKCFECGKRMHISAYKDNTSCYSHLLEKSNPKYRQYKGDPKNVVIVHPDCHALFTLKPTKAVNQYNQMLKLKKEYNI